MSDWRKPIQPLNSENVVYDFFTVANPNKNRKLKKVKKFVPEKLINGVDIHEIHNTFDKNVKQKLSRATSCKNICSKQEQNDIGIVLQNIQNPQQFGAYNVKRVVQITPFNSKPESIVQHSSQTDLRQDIQKQDVIDDLLLDDFNIDQLQDNISQQNILELREKQVEQFALSQNDSQIIENVLKNQEPHHIDVNKSDSQIKIDDNNLNQQLLDRNHSKDNRQCINQNFTSEQEFEGNIYSQKETNFELEILNIVKSESNLLLQENDICLEKIKKSPNINYLQDLDIQNQRNQLLDQLLERELLSQSENESDVFQQSLHKPQEELSDNVALMQSYHSTNDDLLANILQSPIKDLESSQLLQQSMERTKQIILPPPLFSKPKVNFRSNFRQNQIQNKVSTIQYKLPLDRPLYLQILSNNNIHSTFHRASKLFESQFQQQLIISPIGSHKELENYDIFWQQKTEIQQNQIRSDRFINHFLNINKIIHKDQFYQAMRGLTIRNKMFKNIIIDTFILPNQLKSLFLVNYPQDTIFIVKPVNLSRGRGIYLTRNPMEFTNDVQSIIQVYMSNPLLFQGRKIDFRIYVLLFNSHAYLYHEAIVRSSPKQFTIENLSNDIHLTNSSIHGPNYKFSLQKFFNSNTNEELIRQSFRLVTRAVKRVSNKFYSQNSFELLGVDVILDENCIPKIIELNASPSLVSECSADSIKGELICDIIRILQGEVVDNFELIE